MQIFTINHNIPKLIFLYTFTFSLKSNISMASESMITVTVYQIGGAPVQGTPLTLSFPCNFITVQAATNSTISQVQSQINWYANPANPLQVTQVLVSESVSDIAGNSGSSMFEATVLSIGEYIQPPGGTDFLFPSIQTTIGESTDTALDVNSYVEFKGVKYFCQEDASDLVSAANTGGGGSSYLVASVTLTDEQIKALPTTKIQIIAAPGVGKYIKPLFGTAIADIEAAPYTVDPAASIQLLYGNSSFQASCPLVCDVLLGTSNFPFGNISCPNLVVSAGFSGVMTTYVEYDRDDVVNKGLFIGDVYNGVANYTGGDPANSLTITVYYVVVDL